MRAVAFDQATSTSGYAVIEDGQYKRSGIIELRNNTDSDTRFKQMVSQICKIIADEDADCVVVEDVQQQVNKQTFKLLARLQGAIIGYCCVNEIPFLIFPATTWRSRLNFNQGTGIKRRGLKMQAVQYVLDQCKKNVRSDEADAICIGLAAFTDKSTN